MCIIKGGNNNTKRLAYTALVRPILEYEAVCWDQQVLFFKIYVPSISLTIQFWIQAYLILSL